MIGICLGEDTGVGVRIVLGSSRASSNVRSVTASLAMSFCTGFTSISPVLPLHVVQYICMHALKHHGLSGRLTISTAIPPTITPSQYHFMNVHNQLLTGLSASLVFLWLCSTSQPSRPPKMKSDLVTTTPSYSA